MPKGYHHLTKEQRCQLYLLKKRGESCIAIAKELGVARSTIYREIRRNSGQRGYRHQQAHERAVCRRQTSNAERCKMKGALIITVEQKLQLSWSPVQISGWLKRVDISNSISHESIYKYIWLDKRKGGTLYKKLRHSGKKYNKRIKGMSGRGCIPNRVDIDERPLIVEKKQRLGDWELDTIIGAGKKGAIVSMVERFSKLVKLVKIPYRTAEGVEIALIQRLSPVKDFVLTLTSDNGKEFANHKRVKEKLQAGFYFAKPYHSWQRGLNEHTNGLVRQYFPKSMSFAEISKEDLTKVEDLLNNRPRKILKFMTPIEVFSHAAKTVANVALQT